MESHEDHEMMNGGGGYKRYRSDNGSSNPGHGYHNHANVGLMADCGVATYDGQTSAVLIDRMFAHLSRETGMSSFEDVFQRSFLTKVLFFP